jgi:purine-nucleoside phosphorylase
MLRELTKKDWLSILGIPESRIPKALILRGTRNLKTQYELHRSLFGDVLEVGTPNGVLEDVLIGNVDGFPVAYASVYGAPMASEVVHVFGVLGTPLAVQTGSCGALADAIDPGDIFIPKEAYCGEGASQYYKSDGKVVKASSKLVEMACLDPAGGSPVHLGKIYTTSALFAEGERDIEDWFRNGFSAVDMETSATFAVAEHFGMDRVSILYAFDNPRRKEHILMQDSEKDERRKSGNKLMIEMALDVVREYR